MLRYFLIGFELWESAQGNSHLHFIKTLGEEMETSLSIQQFEFERLMKELQALLRCRQFIKTKDRVTGRKLATGLKWRTGEEKIDMAV